MAAGDCVSVTGTASKTSKTTIAARSINVTSPNSSGSCTGVRCAGAGAGGPAGGFQGFRGRTGGGFGEGSGTVTRPSFPAGGSGSSNFRKTLASLAVATGKVTAVKGSTLTVSGVDLSPGNFTRPASGSSNSKSDQKKVTAPKTETLKITTSSSTTVNTTQTATASDLAVGDCVSAFGPAASNGAVTATTVRITSTGGSTCTGASAGSGAGPSSAAVRADPVRAGGAGGSGA